jgi:hypothetical protein
VFEDASMKKELVAIGYDRLSKYAYRASWSTAEVEHFLYFGQDSRQYFVARFGLRNPTAEEFGIEAIAKYGHPNVQLWLRERDAATACSMTFGFAGLDTFSQSPWPRVHLSTISGGDLAILVAEFARQNLLPFVETITDLQTYLAFVVADREPNRWLASVNHMIRAAQVVAVAAQLGRSDAEIRELLRPYDSQIEGRIRHIAADTTMGIDTYLDSLLSDWHCRFREK